MAALDIETEPIVSGYLLDPEIIKHFENSPFIITGDVPFGDYLKNLSPDKLGTANHFVIFGNKVDHFSKDGLKSALDFRTKWIEHGKLFGEVSDDSDYSSTYYESPHGYMQLLDSDIYTGSAKNSRAWPVIPNAKFTELIRQETRKYRNGY